MKIKCDPLTKSYPKGTLLDKVNACIFNWREIETNNISKYRLAYDISAGSTEFEVEENEP